jgi:hypothetical protein
MNTLAVYMDKLKTTLFFSWVIVIVLLIAGSRYIKLAISFLLEKLYGFFIQKNAMRLDE